MNEKLLTREHCRKRAEECQRRALELGESPSGQSWRLLAERLLSLVDQLEDGHPEDKIHAEGPAIAL
jgi:hypothetical protein